MRFAALVAIGLSAACGDLFHGTEWSSRCAAEPAADGCDGAGGGTAATGGGGTSAASGGAGGQGGAAALVACTELAHAQCTGYAKCAPVLDENRFGGDEGFCVERLTLGCVRLNFGPGSTFDPDDLSACTKASAFDGSSCSAAFRVAFGQVVPPACIEPGTLEDGSPCVDAHQCKGSVCTIAADAKCGVCATAAKLGEPCVFTTDCEPNLACIGAACRTPIDIDGSCKDSAECYLDLFCNVDKCVPRLAESDHCDVFLQNCAPLLVCGSEGICEPYAIAPEGGMCGAIGGGLVTCEALNTCSTDPDNPTCVPVAEDGEACAFDDGIFGPQCAFPARCVGKICTIKDAAACP